MANTYDPLDANRIQSAIDAKHQQAQQRQAQQKQQRQQQAQRMAQAQRKQHANNAQAQQRQKKRGGAPGMFQRAQQNQAQNQQVPLPNAQAGATALQAVKQGALVSNTPQQQQLPPSSGGTIHINIPKHEPSTAEKTANAAGFLGSGADTTPHVSMTDERGLPTSTLVLLTGLSLVAVNVFSQSNMKTLWDRVWKKPHAASDVLNQTPFHKQSLLVIVGECAFVLILSVLSDFSSVAMHFSMMLLLGLWAVWFVFNFPTLYASKLVNVFTSGSNNLFGPSGLK